jgi:ligand-binding sensor domain-containing protein/two-component sensor histidine kinase
MNRLFLLTLALLCCSLLHTQQFPVSNYNTTHGLINNRVGIAVQDGAGYMWFGTDDGICNYDGRRFRFFPGVSSQFYFAHSYANGYNDSILFTTYRQGLAVCYKNSLRYITFPGYDTMRLTSVLSLGKEGFLISVLQKNGLMILKDGKLTPVQLPDSIVNSINSFFVLRRDAANNIWLGTEKGLIIFPNGDLQHPVMPAQFKKNWINTVVTDREKNIYLVTHTSIYRYKRSELATIANAQPTVFFGGAADMYSTVAFDQSGNAYIGSQFYAGLTVLDKSGRTTMVINANNGLASSVVWDLVFDKENNMWVCTENGISKLNSIFFRSYTVRGNDFPSFRSGVFINDSTMIGNNGNTNFMLVNHKQVPLETNGSSKDLGGFIKARFYKASDGALWINMQPFINIPTQNTHIATLRGKVLTIGAIISGTPTGPTDINLEQAVNNGAGRDYFLDFNKQLWIYEHHAFTLCRPATTFPAIQAFDAISYGPNGTLWLSNNKHGLLQAKISGDKNGYKIDTVCYFPVENPAPRNFLNHILVDRSGAVWLTSGFKLGIFIYRKNANGQYALSERINTEQLDHNYVREITEGKDGIIYVGTNFGLYRVALKNNRIDHIDKDVFGQFLTGKYIYFLHYKNDNLYIGTTGSVGIVSMPERQEISVAPLVYITGVSVNGKPSDSLLLRERLRLATSDNTLSFTFTSPTFIDEQKTAFRYKLEGVDDDWSAPSYNYTATYSELKPGKYVLRVLAQNAKGLWSEHPAEFRFTIRTPFYKQWWFVALYVIVVAGIVYSIYRFRLSHLLAMERTRQKISKDLHDDVGSALSSITLMNAVLKKKINTHPEDAVELAGKVEETSREMIQSMSDIVWSINPGNDGLEKLQSRLQEFAGAIFEPRNIQYKLVFPKEMTDRALSMELRRDIYLVCKEIMNNAAKYSQATEFSLRFSFHRGKMEIMAEDNGKGFDVKQVKKGNGLTNVVQRVTHHSGSCDIKSDDSGTKWHITI